MTWLCERGHKVTNMVVCREMQGDYYVVTRRFRLTNMM